MVLDNGACTIKLGVSGRDEDPRVFPNCTAKPRGERQVYVGDEMLECRDVAALTVRRPADRGYVVAWSLQKEIWARALRKLLPGGLPAHPAAPVGLVLTEPYMNLPAMREAALQLALGELGFSSVCLATPADLALRAHAAAAPGCAASAAGCGLVIDAGFSFTHVVPVAGWRVVRGGVRRLDLGGKALTNHLKELVSYRSINMMDETYLVERVKEELCFVSADPETDLALARRRPSPHRREYVLPDGVTSTWGHVRDPSAQPPLPAGTKPAPAAAAAAALPVLTLNSERFMVPEALFHPPGIGLEQAGVAEAAAEAVAAVHPHLRPLLCANVLLVGGTAACPGFADRLRAELRPLLPDDYELHVTLAADPARCAWRGGALLAANAAAYGAVAVTRAEWQARGAAAGADRWGAA